MTLWKYISSVCSWIKADVTETAYHADTVRASKSQLPWLPSVASLPEMITDGYDRPVTYLRMS